jgi:CBS domain-containing protein
LLGVRQKRDDAIGADSTTNRAGRSSPYPRTTATEELMKDLERTPAREIMQSDVVLLEALAPLREALETLEEYSIHGAPVVNEAGELVGVFSDTDLVRRDATHEEGTPAPHTYFVEENLANDEDFYSRDDDSALLLDREIVADWMTPKVITMTPNESVGAACRVMSRERIHRVFVVENDRVVGVISALDIVDFLAGPAIAGSPGRARRS